jgi:hypothetical protein
MSEWVVGLGKGIREFELFARTHEQLKGYKLVVQARPHVIVQVKIQPRSKYRTQQQQQQQLTSAMGLLVIQVLEPLSLHDPSACFLALVSIDLLLMALAWLGLLRVLKKVDLRRVLVKVGGICSKCWRRWRWCQQGCWCCSSINQLVTQGGLRDCILFLPFLAFRLLRFAILLPWVGSVVWLGESKAPHKLARCELREVLLLLLLAAKGIDGVHNQRALHAHG